VEDRQLNAGPSRRLPWSDRSRRHVCVDVVFDSTQSFEYSSLVYTGLTELARVGAIDLRYRAPRSEEERILVLDPVIACLGIESTDGSPPRYVAVDLNDSRDYLSRPALERCEAYFKRNYFRPAVGAFESHLAERVFPLGFIYPCGSLASKIRLLRVAGGDLLADGHEGRRRLRQVLALPSLDMLQQSPEQPLARDVFFQTRVWSPSEAPPGEAEPMNEARVALIRALRQALGDRFVGGLIPTTLAQERYRDCLSPLSSRYRSYLRMKKRHLVSICTPGLQHSTPFKWGECLAASQCIVAASLHNELPTPVEEGKHYLPFATPDECAAACHRLLTERALAEAMRRDNHDYFEREVAPSALAARLLGRFVC
jgi:hypothetical protein